MHEKKTPSTSYCTMQAILCLIPFLFISFILIFLCFVYFFVFFFYFMLYRIMVPFLLLIHIIIIIIIFVREKQQKLSCAALLECQKHNIRVYIINWSKDKFIIASRYIRIDYVYIADFCFILPVCHRVCRLWRLPPVAGPCYTVSRT